MRVNLTAARVAHKGFAIPVWGEGDRQGDGNLAFDSIALPRRGWHTHRHQAKCYSRRSKGFVTPVLGRIVLKPRY